MHFLFALTAILTYQNQLASQEDFGLFDQLRAYVLPSSEAFWNLGASTTGAVLGGQYWRLFTYMFLHGNILHIIFNLSALAFLGPLLFGVFGLRRFWLLTLGCGPQARWAASLAICLSSIPAQMWWVYLQRCLATWARFTPTIEERAIWVQRRNSRAT